MTIEQENLGTEIQNKLFTYMTCTGAGLPVPNSIVFVVPVKKYSKIIQSHLNN